MSSDWDDGYIEVDTSVPAIDTAFLGIGNHMASAALLIKNGMHDAADVLLDKQCMEWAVKLREAGLKSMGGGTWFPDDNDLARFGNVINAQLSGLGVARMGDESRVRWVRIAKQALIGEDTGDD